jgi:hypothetical protein
LKDLEHTAVVGVASKDGFYGTLAVDDNATATALTTTPVKIAVFDAVTAESASMTVDSSTDTITVANGGAYVLDFQADIVVDTDSVGYEFQIFRNGSALANFKTLFTQDGIAGDDYGTVVIHGVYEGAADGDAYDVRVAVSTGTANVTLRNSRFSVYTVGVQPVTEEYVRFENSDVDTGTENADSFSATGVSAAEWKYLIKKGTNFKAGIVVATWDGSTAAYNDVATATIGTIDVTLSVDLSGGNVRLRATATTNDWIVKGVRTIIG